MHFITDVRVCQEGGAASAERRAASIYANGDQLVFYGSGAVNRCQGPCDRQRLDIKEQILFLSVRRRSFHCSGQKQQQRRNKHLCVFLHHSSGCLTVAAGRRETTQDLIVSSPPLEQPVTVHSHVTSQGGGASASLFAVSYCQLPSAAADIQGPR